MAPLTSRSDGFSGYRRGGSDQKSEPDIAEDARGEPTRSDRDDQGQDAVNQRFFMGEVVDPALQPDLRDLNDIGMFINNSAASRQIDLRLIGAFDKVGGQLDRR